MLTPATEFCRYRMRLPLIQAAVIDANWLAWLTKEKGYTSISIGDYFIKGNNGEEVMPKVNFERLFELADE